MAFAGAADFHQVHGLCFARFKANGSACGNIETHAVGGRAIKIQFLVDFEEMEVGTYLNRAIRGIGDVQNEWDRVR